MRFKKLAIFAALSVFAGAAIAAEGAIRVSKALDIIEKNKDVVILDVRTVEEFQTEHYDKAKNIPLSELPWQMDTMDKESQIVVYCHSGRRSAEAKRILDEAGFKNVLNAGGLKPMLVEKEFRKNYNVKK